MIVNLTNDAWFAGSSEPWLHLALAKFRAVEHRLFLVRATMTGASAIIDPIGRELEVAPPGTSAELVRSVGWLGGQTIYAYLGDTGWWVLTVASLAASLLPRRFRCHRVVKGMHRK
jgi:apolipoprotein N-acyltransferase